MPLLPFYKGKGSVSSSLACSAVALLLGIGLLITVFYALTLTK